MGPTVPIDTNKINWLSIFKIWAISYKTLDFLTLKQLEDLQLWACSPTWQHLLKLYRTAHFRLRIHFSFFSTDPTTP